MQMLLEERSKFAMSLTVLRSLDYSLQAPLVVRLGETRWISPVNFFGRLPKLESVQSLMDFFLDSASFLVVLCFTRLNVR